MFVARGLLHHDGSRVEVENLPLAAESRNDQCSTRKPRSKPCFHFVQTSCSGASPRDPKLLAALATCQPSSRLRPSTVPADDARQRRSRGGRPRLPDAERRTVHLGVALTPAEAEAVADAAAAAGLPPATWLRMSALRQRTPSAHRADLREIWRQSSTLQSNFNQLTERLNELHAAGELRSHNSATTLLEMHGYMPKMYRLIKEFRVDLLRR